MRSISSHPWECNKYAHNYMYKKRTAQKTPSVRCAARVMMLVARNGGLCNLVLIACPASSLCLLLSNFGCSFITFALAWEDELDQLFSEKPTGLATILRKRTMGMTLDVCTRRNVMQHDAVGVLVHRLSAFAPPSGEFFL